MNNKELFEALRMFEAEKEIPMSYMIDQIEKAIVIACKNYYNGNDNVVFNIDPDRNVFDVKLKKDVVEEVFDPDYEITKYDAEKIDKKHIYSEGMTFEMPLDPKKLGRIAVASARNVIRQGIRAGEKGQTLLEFQSKLGELVSAQVERVDAKTGIASIRIGKSEAMLPKAEQIGHENLKEGDFIKVYIADVKDNEKGPHAIISRTHPGLVRRLFEQEVPEIFDGIVEIKSIAREAGSRTKMAVFSNNPDIDATGSSIGPKGARVNKIVEELGGEKIDIVEYNEDPSKYIAAALQPANVLKVEITDENSKSCRATVPDGQLSLAIGNKGQNARLAARLTGWRIDIRPESGFFGEDEDEEEENLIAEESATEEVVENTDDAEAVENAENVEELVIEDTEEIISEETEDNQTVSEEE